LGYSGSLEKMMLTSFTDDSFTPTSQKDQTFVYINPSQYSHSYTICYNDTQAQGSSAGSPEYNKTPGDVVTFQLTQIDKFMKLAFDYDGEIHSPNFVQLAWGTLIFNCRLSKLNITYTLFKPDGTPLRAKADVTFVEYRNQQEIAKEENAQSPDLSKVVTVKGGDTLPFLCYGIYGTSVYYAEVARVNGMTGFRELIPGEKILFPPLGDASTGVAR
jgi:hypothetical protein